VTAGLRDYLSLIKFSHSVFALPFALMALLVATAGEPGWSKLALVVAAVVAARTAAMAYNRFADREMDARNPRTRIREIPRGVVRPGAALALALGAGGVFLLCCWWIAPVCLALGIPVLLWLYGYSHAKRFTSLVHLWLGVSLGLAPVAAWVAGAGEVGADVAPAVVLGVGVALWVAGFDVLYACQDEAFDREVGLQSIPARWGRRRALTIAASLHLLAVPCFAWFGVSTELGVAYFAGVGAAAALLVWEHWLLRPGDLSRISMAFFTANGLVSVAMLAATCIALYF